MNVQQIHAVFRVEAQSTSENRLGGKVSPLQNPGDSMFNGIAVQNGEESVILGNILIRNPAYEISPLQIHHFVERNLLDNQIDSILFAQFPDIVLRHRGVPPGIHMDPQHSNPVPVGDISDIGTVHAPGDTDDAVVLSAGTLRFHSVEHGFQLGFSMTIPFAGLQLFYCLPTVTAMAVLVKIDDFFAGIHYTSAANFGRTHDIPLFCFLRIE